MQAIFPHTLNKSVLLPCFLMVNQMIVNQYFDGLVYVDG